MKRGRQLTCREPGSAQWNAWEATHQQGFHYPQITHWVVLLCCYALLISAIKMEKWTETKVLLYWFKTHVDRYISITNTLWHLHGGGTASSLPVSLHFLHSFLPVGQSHPCDLRPRWPPHLGSAHQTTSGTTEKEKEKERVILAVIKSRLFSCTVWHADIATNQFVLGRGYG